MKKIAVTGLSGVVGQIVKKTASQEDMLIDLFHRSPCSNHDTQGKIIHKHIDLLSKESTERTLSSIEPDVIIHMAAMTHIDTCEKDKTYGKDGIVWKTNVEGTRNIVSYCAKNSVPIVYLSTECVFDGKKNSYREHDKKNPRNWYGRTKHEAEDIVLSSGVPASVIRGVIAYHDKDNQNTIFGKFVSLLKKKNEIFVVGDQKFTPTYTYDISKAIGNTVRGHIHGVFHVSPDISLSPYEFVTLLATQYNLDVSRVRKTTLVSFFGKTRASLRLPHACLSQTYSNIKLSIMPKKPIDAFNVMTI